MAARAVRVPVHEHHRRRHPRRATCARSSTSIILPSASPERLISGDSRRTSCRPSTPAASATRGVAALKAFVESGGTLDLPRSGRRPRDRRVRAAASRRRARASSDKFFCPGSILRLDLDPAQPLGLRDARRTPPAFFAFSSAYEASAARRGTSIRPAARALRRQGSAAERLARRRRQLIAGRAAVVQVSVGTGRVVLLGFPVQHRGAVARHVPSAVQRHLHVAAEKATGVFSATIR